MGDECGIRVEHGGSGKSNGTAIRFDGDGESGAASERGEGGGGEVGGSGCEIEDARGAGDVQGGTLLGDDVS